MKRSFFALALGALLSLLTACGGSAAAPTASTAASPGGGAAKPASSGAWAEVVAAAKKEGKISLIGPQGSEMRDALTQAFQKAYPGVEVDLQSLPGDQIGPKVLTP